MSAPLDKADQSHWYVSAGYLTFHATIIFLHDDITCMVTDISLNSLVISIWLRIYQELPDLDGLIYIAPYLSYYRPMTYAYFNFELLFAYDASWILFKLFWFLLCCIENERKNYKQGNFCIWIAISRGEWRFPYLETRKKDVCAIRQMTPMGQCRW